MEGTPAPTPAKCSYKDCPHDAWPGKDLCIFHLPVDQKTAAEFWKHLAAYLNARYQRVMDDDVWKFYTKGQGWFHTLADQTLTQKYNNETPRGPAWIFTGFVFPPMDAERSFARFVLRAANFNSARFAGPANFADAVFTGATNFESAEFAEAADFSRTVFATTADLTGATFSGRARFREAVFQGAAEFEHTNFEGGPAADFMRADFGSSVSFFGAEFAGTATFLEATFAKASFHTTTFRSDVEFFKATFTEQCNMRAAKFRAGARFYRVTFGGPASFTRAEVADALNFYRANLRSQLLFEGTRFTDAARVLLWGLSFGQAQADVRGSARRDAEAGQIEGEVLDPRREGEVVFRDIAGGMDRVSLLHTEVFSTRPFVRFHNVRWPAASEGHLYDARFVPKGRERIDVRKTAEGTDFDTLCRLFHQSEDKNLSEAGLTARTRDASLLLLIQQDVERIAREIRKSTEALGSYRDAGDYYVAEMEYRRCRAGTTGFEKLVLWLYKWGSNYGESPKQALSRLLVLLCLATLAYPFLGFRFQDSDVRLLLNLEPQRLLPTVAAFGQALLFSVGNMVPGYFRFQSLSASNGWTAAVSVIQAILSAIILALFLLALRRRFSR